MNTKTARTPARRSSTVPTVASATTIDALVALARTVTIANFVAIVASIRAAFVVDHARRNVGRTTNRRIMDFQSWTLTRNADWKLSDEQLAALWIGEYPNAVGRVFRGEPSDIIGIVRGVRALFNAGRHATGYAVPNPASVAYGDTATMKPHVMFPRAIPTVPAAALNPAKPTAYGLGRGNDTVGRARKSVKRTAA